MGKKPARPTLIADTPQHPTRFAAEKPKAVLVQRERARAQKINALKLKSHEIEEPARQAAENVEELMESIRAIGMQVPPLVWHRGPGDYVILAGHRRVTAWTLLARRGEVQPEILVHTISGIDDREAIYIIAAETYQSEGFSAVQDARVIGRLFEELRKELGRDPSQRAVARFIPSRKTEAGRDTDNSTAVNEALTIYRALQDPRLADAVRSADNAGKKTLATILRCDDLETRMEALKLAADGKAAEAKRLVRKKAEPEPEPRAVVHRRKLENGVGANVEVHCDAPMKDILAAANALEEILNEIREFAKAG